MPPILSKKTVSLSDVQIQVHYEMFQWGFSVLGLLNLSNFCCFGNIHWWEFFKKNLEDMSPFSGATDTSVLDFWSWWKGAFVTGMSFTEIETWCTQNWWEFVCMRMLSGWHFFMTSFQWHNWVHDAMSSLFEILVFFITK